MINLGPNIFFLDTNIIVDYIEERSIEIKKILDEMIIFAKNGELVLATSIYNIAEILDSELDIYYYSHCKYNNKMSDNEIRSKKGDITFYRTIANINRDSIETKLNTFIIDSDIAIFKIPCNDEMDELYDLLCDKCLQSQDAMIISTAIYNESDYLLTNDKKLLDSLGTKIYTFDLSSKAKRDAFKRELRNLNYPID